MKDTATIERLLERYWEGETTLAEEQLLKAYFRSGAVDPSLRQFAALFLALQAEKAIELPDHQLKVVHKAAPLRTMRMRFFWAAAGLTAVVAGALWMMRPAQPQDTWVADQKPATAPAPLQQPVKEALAVVKKVVNTAPKPKNKRKPKAEEPLDPETIKAIEEVKYALSLVSSKINKGRREAVKGTIQLDIDAHIKHKTEG